MRTCGVKIQIQLELLFSRRQKSHLNFDTASLSLPDELLLLVVGTKYFLQQRIASTQNTLFLVEQSKTRKLLLLLLLFVCVRLNKGP